jgi:hypothetical protein
MRSFTTELPTQVMLAQLCRSNAITFLSIQQQIINLINLRDAETRIMLLEPQKPHAQQRNL